MWFYYFITLFVRTFVYCMGLCYFGIAIKIKVHVSRYIKKPFCRLGSVLRENADRCSEIHCYDTAGFTTKRLGTLRCFTSIMNYSNTINALYYARSFDSKVFKKNEFFRPFFIHWIIKVAWCFRRICPQIIVV